MSMEFVNKPKSYALIAHTRGDDLISPTQKVIAVSKERDRLERLREERAAERAAWLESNQVVWWQQCSIIVREEIVEVPVA